MVDKLQELTELTQWMITHESRKITERTQNNIKKTLLLRKFNWILLEENCQDFLEWEIESCQPFFLEHQLHFLDKKWLIENTKTIKSDFFGYCIRTNRFIGISSGKINSENEIHNFLISPDGDLFEFKNMVGFDQKIWNLLVGAKNNEYILKGWQFIEDKLILSFKNFATIVFDVWQNPAEMLSHRWKYVFDGFHPDWTLHINVNEKLTQVINVKDL